MAAFTATLLQGPSELRGMRQLLTSWLKLTDATKDVRGAVLLATHEEAANAIEHGQPESPVSVSASQDESGAFVVEVTSLRGWKETETGHPCLGLTMMSGLMSGVEIHARTRVSMLSG